jgi:class 3 adenylate cyclase
VTELAAGSDLGYDAFISHAAPDLPQAQKLAARLVAAGLRVFLLEWESPGVVPYAVKEAALLTSANGILVFSHATMSDPAIRDDYAALLWRVHTGGRLFIPVLVDDVPLPAFAAIRKPLDLHNAGDAEYDNRVATLIRALRPDATPAASQGSHASGGFDPERARTEIRMGFTLDIVSYSARSAPVKEDAQHRLVRLIDEVLGDLTLSQAQTDQQSTGDGMIVFLPVRMDVPHALPILLHSWRDRLAADNQRSRDRLRLRMSVAIGPVGTSVMGFTGSTVIELSRLLDSDVIRREIADQPAIDLAVLVSDQLYAYVVGDGYPGLDPGQFRRHQVQVKKFSAPAWLWTG